MIEILTEILETFLLKSVKIEFHSLLFLQFRFLALILKRFEFASVSIVLKGFSRPFYEYKSKLDGLSGFSTPSSLHFMELSCKTFRDHPESDADA